MNTMVIKTPLIMNLA